MEQLQLALPSTAYLASFREACREYHEAGVTDIFNLFDPDEPRWWQGNGTELFALFDKQRRGIDLPENHVPSTTFWLIGGGQFLGAANLRHRLSPRLERYGGHIGYHIRPSRWGRGYGTEQCRRILREAHRMGINPALLTCKNDNESSIRIIEKCGGKLLDIVENSSGDGAFLSRRYWVPTGE